MSQSRLFLSINQSCDDALQWADDRLKTTGMAGLRTFNMKVSQSLLAECTCPHHGTTDCTCQVVFLLVYGEKGQIRNEQNNAPVSLMIHGHEDETWFYIVDNPQQRPDPRLEARVRQALTPAFPGSASNPSPVAS